jgi:hypothetical protein
LGGLRFEAIPGKKLVRPSASQPRAGRGGARLSPQLREEAYTEPGWPRHKHEILSPKIPMQKGLGGEGGGSWEMVCLASTRSFLLRTVLDLQSN